MVLGVNARVSVPKKPFNGKDTLQQDEIERIKNVLVVRPDSPQAWQWWGPFAISVRLGCATAKNASQSTPVDAL